MFKGDRYKNLQPAICINILNYKYFKEKENYITELRVVDIETKNIFTQDFQIFLIEVPKALKESYTELSKWMRFLKGASREEIFSMDNPFILKAQEKLEYLSQDFQARIQYNSRQKYLHDYMSDTASKFEEGMEIGMEKGINIGVEKGINIGVEKGENKKNIENAKKLYQFGVSIDIISKTTGLTQEEIENA
ncbi:hypothetical protein AXG55_10720 [Silvanigrella aquatica]|uniref:Rpn family recombination-promoting nuclease/putative transposase n=1 Tax=Silvanigrella aquatica TaxID=1915309 RepID=A0A1L4D2B7_9BACT|nr:hypothetical protein AXG55_10720 [Silvanigrella aquatica]